MKETKWINEIVLSKLRNKFEENNNIFVDDQKKLPYAFEVKSYNEKSHGRRNINKYATDLLIYEKLDENNWKPRIVIEGKINSVTTHDAISYSQKASSHKNVHPYLRYGILIGNRKHYPLPGRLFRHGENFDFMVSFKKYEPSEKEWDNFINIVEKELRISNKLEEMLYNSRSPYRKKYTSLHRQLILEE